MKVIFISLLLSCYCARFAVAEERIHISIPSSSADISLRLYVKQTRRQILFPYDLVKSYKTNSVQGYFSADEALTMLLKDTGLAALVENNQLIVHASFDHAKKIEIKNTLANPAETVFAVSSTLNNDEATTQDENPIRLEEIVVTAQKRSQNLQDTPISIFAFDRQVLKEQGIWDMSDVSQYTPNVQIVQSPGGSTGVTIAMRGSVTINPVVTIDTNVGIYLDGVFIAKNVGGLFDVAELERIEILRGPQGTLYGKNTVGGAINLISHKPSGKAHEKVRFGVGNYNYGSAFVSIDTDKLFDKVSLNMAYSQQVRDGFYDNKSDAAKIDKFKSMDSVAARVAMLYEATDSLDIFYSYDMNEKDNTPSLGQIDKRLSERLNSSFSDGAESDKAKRSGHSIHTTVDITDKMILKSISAYRKLDFNDTNDYDGGDSKTYLLHTKRDVTQSQVSQEFQLLGKTDKFNYVLGLFYFKENIHVYNPLIQEFYPLVSYNVRHNSYGLDSISIATYGQLDWLLNESLNFTVGARLTTEKKSGFVKHPNDDLIGGIPYFAEMDDRWTNFSPMAVVTFYWDDDVSQYFKVTQGWKSGGFNAEAPNKFSAQRSYNEESVTSIEMGLKSRWFDKRLQVNGAIFNNNIEDLQLSQLDTSFYSEIFNAGESTVQGLELEVLCAVTKNVTANFNYGYLHAKYNKFFVYGADIKDQALFAYTPKHTGSLGLSYNKKIGLGELSARFDWSYTDSHVVSHDVKQANITKINSYNLVNMRIGLSNVAKTSIDVAIWGKNLTDEEYRINGIPLGKGVAVNYFGDPRTYGVDISYKF